MMARNERITTALTRGNGHEDFSFDTVLAGFAAKAADEETGQADIAASIAQLRDADLLLDDGTSEPELTARRLIRVGAANLPVGRLWEGHVNALNLVKTYAARSVRAKVGKLLTEGAFLGVWGADDTAPVRWGTGAVRLTGGKKFASGLGTVTHAIVTVNSGPDVRLALIDVTDAVRADASTWRMPGMQSTASGRFDFNDLPVSSLLWIGSPGDYVREPYFVGGVWRIAALQIGGAVGLIDAATAHLRALGRMGSEAQKTRLGQVMMRALAGSALVERAARMVLSDAPDKAVALSIAARLQTEDCALDAIQAVEQSVGLAHFEDGSVTGRRARDLSVYLRQAARDAMLIRFADHAFASDSSIGELLR